MEGTRTAWLRNAAATASSHVPCAMAGAARTGRRALARRGAGGLPDGRCRRSLAGQHRPNRRERLRRKPLLPTARRTLAGACGARARAGHARAAWLWPRPARPRRPHSAQPRRPRVRARRGLRHRACVTTMRWQARPLFCSLPCTFKSACEAVCLSSDAPDSGMQMRSHRCTRLQCLRVLEGAPVHAACASSERGTVFLTDAHTPHSARCAVLRQRCRGSTVGARGVSQTAAFGLGTMALAASPDWSKLEFGLKDTAPVRFRCCPRDRSAVPLARRSELEALA